MKGITTPPGSVEILTGTYTGDGTDDRDIDIGVDLSSKSHVWIVTKGTTTSYGLHRIEYGQGDLTAKFMNVGDSADLIQAFTATGFQVGSNAHINQNGVVFRYVVFWK